MKPKVEKLITLAKRGDLHARRQALVGAGPGQVHRPQAVRGGRAALRRPPRRLHADREARPAPFGLDRDGLHRARLSSPAVPTYRLDIAYDGRAVRRLGRQPGLRTIQGEIEAGLGQDRDAAALTVAGRTDTGVHAWGQVASFELARQPPLRTCAALSTRSRRARSRCYAADRGAPTASTPAATPAPAPTATGSWPRASPARSRRAAPCGGRTRSTATRSTPAPRPLVGTHDFTAFTPTQTEHVRFERDVLPLRVEPRSAGIGPEPDARAVDRGRRVHAQHGPVLVGTMLEVAAGGVTPDRLHQELLEGAPARARGETAPPHGLYLASVSY